MTDVKIDTPAIEDFGPITQDEARRRNIQKVIASQASSAIKAGSRPNQVISYTSALARHLGAESNKPETEPETTSKSRESTVTQK